MSTTFDPFSELAPDELLALIDSIEDPAELDALEDVILGNVEIEQAEKGPTQWVRALFPGHVRAPFAAHHEQLLQWAWDIEPEVRPRPQLDIWARGGAKSTLAELCTAMVAARGTRRFGLYVGRTDTKAEEHLDNIKTLLESKGIERLYPEIGQRSLTKYGHSRGWNATRLRTDTFTIDAVGIETAVRGIKVDEFRPDWIVVDDIDDQFDSPAVVAKMIAAFKDKLLQAGAPWLATLVIQNLVHLNGVIAQIADGRAEALADRIQSGPIPAIVGPYTIEHTGDERSYEEGGRPWRIVGGEPSWAGQDRAACELKLADVGPTSWESEAQHKPKLLVGGMYEDVLGDVKHIERAAVPDLVRKAIAVDPALVDSDASDSHGVQCDGIAEDGVIYRLRSWEERAAPGTALQLAITWAYEEGVPEVIVEMVGTDLSGRSVEQSWRKAFKDADDEVRKTNAEWAKLPRRRIKRARATSSQGSKAQRSSTMHADYERPGRIVHVIGDHDVLEAALGRVFVVKPFDLADAAFYSWNDLRGRGRPGTAASEAGSVRR